MKLEKVDHKHALTSWLKVIIFSILMLVPFMDVAIRCGYVLLNKNAYQSYSGTPTSLYYEIENGYYNTNEINDASDILIDNVYYVNKDNSYTSTAWQNQDFANVYITFLFIQVDEINYSTIEFDVQVINSNSLTPYINISDGYFYVGAKDANYDSYFEVEVENLVFSGIVQVIDYNDDGFLSYSVFESAENVPYSTYKEVTTSTLDNVFDYSVNKISESPLYNWTRNTAIYTGVNAMCSGLGMPTDLVAILLTYWFILTVIYIIIDIVLNMFVWLTHMFNRKAT